LALLAAFVGVVAAADADSKVVVLDEKSFDKFVADTPLALIEFFAPCTCFLNNSDLPLASDICTYLVVEFAHLCRSHR